MAECAVVAPFHARTRVTAFELCRTRDAEVRFPDGAWGTIPKRPPGPGWMIADATRERHTLWRRPVDAWLEDGRGR